MSRIEQTYKTLALKDNKVFSRLYSKGKFAASREVVIYYLPNKLGYTRFGITAGKKLGSAVKRNRAKRIIRSAYRSCESLFPKSLDMVAVAREGIAGKKSGDIERAMRHMSACMRRQKNPSKTKKIRNRRAAGNKRRKSKRRSSRSR